jgi:hypothetical protein
MEKAYQVWARKNNIMDQDQQKASRMIFEAAWNARGNVWAHTVAVIFFLAFLAYFATIH